MNIRHNEELREKLAAEYALGTLTGGARRRLETWMKDDAALRRSVAEWMDRLSPMAEFSSAVQPPPGLWTSLAKQLDLKQSPVQRKWNYWMGLREDLGFWRGLGMVSTTAALLLLSVLLTRPADVPATSFVAMLNDDNAQLIAVATGNADQDRMTLKVVQRQTLAADKSLELWAITKEGKVRSVGLIGEDGNYSVALADSTSPTAAPILAVTLEPKGGSGNPDKASGPILFKGAWIKI